jgi:DNA-binding NtrC family response regulator
MSARVLVVDDEAELARGLAKVLGRRGFEVAVAADGEAALAAVAAQRFDVVLLDIKMPGRDGLAILPEIGARAPGTPVVLMTGHLSPDGVPGPPPGAFAYVIKPHRIPELVAVIEAAARAREASGAGR